MADNERFRFLFERYAKKEAREQEKEELFALIGRGEYNILLDDLINEQWNGSIPEWIRKNDTEKAEVNFDAIMRRIKVRRIGIFRRMAAAAAIILLAAFGGYLLLVNKNTQQP